MDPFAPLAPLAPFDAFADPFLDVAFCVPREALWRAAGRPARCGDAERAPEPRACGAFPLLGVPLAPEAFIVDRGFACEDDAPRVVPVRVSCLRRSA